MFLCPTTSTGPFPGDIGRFADRTIRTDRSEQAYASLPFWIAHASLTGLPAVSIPIVPRPGICQCSVIGLLYEDDTAIPLPS